MASDGLDTIGHDHFARISFSARQPTSVHGSAVVTIADELGLEFRDHDAKVDALDDRTGDEDPVQEDQGLKPAEVGHACQVQSDKEAEACVEGVDDGIDDLDGGGGVDPDRRLQVCDIEAQHQSEGWDLKKLERERERSKESTEDVSVRVGVFWAQKYTDDWAGTLTANLFVRRIEHMCSIPGVCVGREETKRKAEWEGEYRLRLDEREVGFSRSRGISSREWAGCDMG